MGTPPILRSNGQFVRDFIHVQESAWAHLDLAEPVAGDAAVRGEAFNYSYGVGYTVLELVNKILTIADADLEVVIEGTARHEIQDMVLSSEKARSLLGWRPRMTFEESLKTTVQWYLGYFRRSRGRRVI